MYKPRVDVAREPELVWAFVGWRVIVDCRAEGKVYGEKYVGRVQVI